MSAKKAHPSVAKGYMARHLLKSGARVPAKFQTPAPLVVWRGADCGCWLLRVSLTPEGWALDGRDFNVPMDEWLARQYPEGAEVEGVALTLENYRAGKYASLAGRKVTGVARLLALDVGEWATGDRMEVGCFHGHGLRPLSDLADDCREVRATRRVVKRRIDWTV